MRTLSERHGSDDTEADVPWRVVAEPTQRYGPALVAHRRPAYPAPWGVSVSIV